MFIRLLAQMFSGYRSHLTLIRIHPKPVITFNKVSSSVNLFDTSVVVKFNINIFTNLSPNSWKTNKAGSIALEIEIFMTLVMKLMIETMML